jgi:hypothetical protein
LLISVIETAAGPWAAHTRPSPREAPVNEPDRLPGIDLDHDAVTATIHLLVLVREAGQERGAAERSVGDAVGEALRGLSPASAWTV